MKTKRFRAKKGERYYFVELDTFFLGARIASLLEERRDSYGAPSSDFKRYKMFNYFKTKKEAKIKLIQILKLLREK